MFENLKKRLFHIIESEIRILLSIILIGMHTKVRNSSDRALNRYENAHKTRKECVLAPACLAKSHRDAILTSREGLAELLLKYTRRYRNGMASLFYII